MARKTGAAHSLPGMSPARSALPPPEQAFCTYQIIFDLPAPARIAVGRFGSFDFPAGRYCYTGSARRAFEARIRRHLSREKRLRWHIDYLLSAPGVRIVDVHRLTLPECEVNRQTAGEVVVAGFGASDCRAACGSHLKRIGAAALS
ncbi:GIY-YIG nuclease family protein [Rhodocyclus tenuis]|uniref:GIY-YIG nuclease family protein n=1 Tax=Rhodocyclus tenuis TaxID=1066 RepID=UPI001F5B18D5|nr:GIY-YIG nuclease family protein [Rhodocyclus tenuis]